MFNLRFAVQLAARFACSRRERYQTLALILLVAVLLGLVGTLSTISSTTRIAVDAMGDTPKYTRMEMVIKNAVHGAFTLDEVARIASADGSGLASAVPWLTAGGDVPTASGEFQHLNIRSTVTGDPDLGGLAIERNSIILSDRILADLGYQKLPNVIQIRLRGHRPDGTSKERWVLLTVRMIESSRVADSHYSAFVHAEDAAEWIGWQVSGEPATVTRIIAHANGAAFVEQADTFLRERYVPAGFEIHTNFPALKEYRTVSRAVNRIATGLIAGIIGAWFIAMAAVVTAAIQRAASFLKFLHTYGASSLFIRAILLTAVGASVVIGIAGGALITAVAAAKFIKPAFKNFGIEFESVQIAWATLAISAMAGLALASFLCVFHCQLRRRPASISLKRSAASRLPISWLLKRWPGGSPGESRRRGR